MANSNIKTYNQKSIVDLYSASTKIFTTENEIIKEYSSRILNTSMLDIGIGGGRTTRFFAPKQKIYVGFDFAENMVKSCIKKFSHFENAKFLCADATKLPTYNLGTFNFILFSINGIDYIEGIEDRNKTLKNIYNSLNHNGVFVFSTHNTFAIKRLYSFQCPRNLFKIGKEINRLKKLKNINSNIDISSKESFMQLYDGGEFFDAFTAYIKPSYQLNILKEVGFSEIIAYDIKGGKINLDAIDKCDDNWIYFVCLK